MIEKKEIILTNSFKLFKEKGYNNTTTREIAEVSNIKRGLLYYYYKKKEDILFYMYSDFIDQVFKFCSEKLNENEYLNMIGPIYYRLYYKIIFSEEYLINIYIDLLNNRKLIQYKIKKTFDVLKKLYDRYNIKYDECKLYIYAAGMIGCEIQIIQGNIEGEIQLSTDELVSTLLRWDLTIKNIEVETRDKIIKDSLKKQNLFLLNDFEIYFKNNIIWYRNYKEQTKLGTLK